MGKDEVFDEDSCINRNNELQSTLTATKEMWSRLEAMQNTFSKSKRENKKESNAKSRRQNPAPLSNLASIKGS